MNRHYSKQEALNIIRFLRRGQLPNWVKNSVQHAVNKHRFIKLCQAFELDHTNRHLMQKQPRRWVIITDKIDETIKQYYDNPATFSNNRDKLYDRINRDNIGILRSDVGAFLQKHESYQLSKPMKTIKIVRPPKVNRPLESLQMDLTPMNPQALPNAAGDQFWLNLPANNNNYSQILNIIDVFSKYVWSYPLKAATQQEVLKALREFMRKPLPIIPSKISSDNGPEFGSKVKQFLNQHNIVLIHSPSHTPMAQGLVERVNQTIKNKLWTLMKKHGTNNWIQYHKDVISNYNSEFHGTIKKTPRELMDEYTGVYIAEGEDAAAEHVKPLADKYKEGRDRAELRKQLMQPKIKPGNFIRIWKGVEDPEVRKFAKSHHLKAYVSAWTDKVFKAKSVSKMGVNVYWIDANGNMTTRLKIIPISQCNWVLQPSSIVRIKAPTKAARQSQRLAVPSEIRMADCNLAQEQEFWRDELAAPLATQRTRRERSLPIRFRD